MTDLLPEQIEALKGVLWMAEEWLEHIGSSAMNDDEHRAKIQTAKTAIEAYEATRTPPDDVVGHTEKLRNLVKVLLDNDPDDMVSDCHTVLELWRHEARQLIGKPALQASDNRLVDAINLAEAAGELVVALDGKTEFRELRLKVLNAIKQVAALKDIGR